MTDEMISYVTGKITGFFGGDRSPVKRFDFVPAQA
jgi:hypothetical protein